MTTEHTTGTDDLAIALWLPAEGGVATIEMPPTGDDLHGWIRRVLGVRLIELVRLDERTDMWLDEEFLFHYDRPNLMATRVAGAHGFDFQAYRGPALLTGGATARADTRGLDGTSASLLAAMAFYSAAEGPLMAHEVDGHRFVEMQARRDRAEA